MYLVYGEVDAVERSMIIHAFRCALRLSRPHVFRQTELMIGMPRNNRWNQMRDLLQYNKNAPRRKYVL